MLIRAIAVEIYKTAGIEPKEEQLTQVEAVIHQQFRGEQVYITARPKDLAIRMAKQARHNARKLAALTGLSERHARRTLGGK